jgi:predicted lipoprotein with Yx(FWY)xxD motif
MVLAVSAALAMSMAACGGDDKPVTSASGGQPSTTALVTTTTAAPATTTTAAKPTVATASSAKLGTVLVDASGKTLYTFDNDSGGTSTCKDACATKWPPLVLAGGTSTPVAGTGVSGLTVVARPDDASKMQVAVNGKPLYTYSLDTAAGDTNGDGVGGVWHAAKPA